MSLIVTYTTTRRTNEGLVPVMAGWSCRSEVLTLSGGSNVEGALSAVSGETVVDLCATEALWFAAGPAPVATVGGSGCRYLGANERLQLAVRAGDKVAAIKV